MSSRITNFIAGGLGGIFFVLALLPVFYKTNTFGSASLIDKVFPPRVEVKTVEKQVITASEDEQIKEAVKKSRESVLAIKSFREGRLSRFGSGVAVTRDGLIVTASQVVPENQHYQIFHKDKIYSGQVVKRDLAKNLAMVKISEEPALRPAIFEDNQLAVGETMLIEGKISPLRQAELFAYRALISRLENQGKKIILDSRYENYFSGAGLVAKDGSFQGLVYIDGSRALAVPSSLIRDFINSYLNKAP